MCCEYSNQVITHTNKPSFLVIGAQKAGTSSLFMLLDSMQGICGSSEKELSFFLHDSLYAQGIESYLNNFSLCNKNEITFEATPAYIYAPYVPERIYKFNKEMKFIVLLRDPVERCYSAWNMFRRFNSVNPGYIYEKYISIANANEKEAIKDLLFSGKYPSFEDAVEEDIARYEEDCKILEPSFVRRGLYYEQICRYLVYFDLKNFLFIESVELNNYKELLKKIAKFLEIYIPDNQLKRPSLVNPGQYELDDSSLKNTFRDLKMFYFEHNEKLFQLLGYRYSWNDV
jgi:hypothetical protein